MCGGFPAGTRTYHQTLQQAVGCQPVGSVHAGAGHLTGREQARQIGPAVHVGAHPAAAVVRAGNHRNQLARRVDTGVVAGRGHGRETLGEPLNGPGVEKHTFVSGVAHTCFDGRGHHIARGQIAHRVDAGHHRLSAGIE